jgi:hypothetical protein
MKYPHLYVIIGLLIASSAYSAQQSEYDRQRDERLQRAREERKQQQQATEKQQKQSQSTVTEENPQVDQSELLMWKKRYAELLHTYRSQFKGKNIGDDIEINQNNGQVLRGKLAGIGGNAVVIQTTDGTQSISQPSMTTLSRQTFFADEYAKAMALRDVTKERQDWESEKLAKAKATQAEQEEELSKLLPSQRDFISNWKKTGKYKSFQGALQVGSIGTFEDLLQKHHVAQILSENDMLVDAFIMMQETSTRSVPAGSDYRGVVYVSENVTAWAPKRTSVWITGVSTSGLVDGQIISLPQLFMVKETKRYQTAIGSSKTVFVMTPFEIPEVFKSR